MKKFLLFTLILSILIVPIFSFAQGPENLIPCGRDIYPAGTQVDGRDVGGQVVPCEFNDFMKLVNNVVSFALFYLAVPIAAIMFAYAGFLLVTSGGSTEARGKAKRIFTSSIIGLVLAVAAFLIVNTILSILGYDGSWIGFKKDV